MTLEDLSPIIFTIIGDLIRLFVLCFFSFVFSLVYLFVPFVLSLAVLFFMIYQWFVLFVHLVQLKKMYINLK